MNVRKARLRKTSDMSQTCHDVMSKIPVFFFFFFFLGCSLYRQLVKNVQFWMPRSRLKKMSLVKTRVVVFRARGCRSLAWQLSAAVVPPPATPSPDMKVGLQTCDLNVIWHVGDLLRDKGGRPPLTPRSLIECSLVQVPTQTPSHPDPKVRNDWESLRFDGAFLFQQPP